LLMFPRMESMELMTYNAFGIVEVKFDQVVVKITAADLEGTPINRSITIDIEDSIVGIEPGEEGRAAFGASVRAGEKSPVMYVDLARPKEWASIGKIPEVVSAMETAIRMIVIASSGL
jgi:hypothetical protein